MAKPLLNIESDATGKTVEQVTYGGPYAAVHFTDGTVLVFEAENGYDADDPPSIDMCYREIRDAYSKHSLDIISNEEYAAAVAEGRAEAEKHERAEFERLKAKFEAAGAATP